MLVMPEDAEERCKVYGPYTRGDGRKHVVLHIKGNDGTVTKTSMSYPKYLMERHIARPLDDDETVDHQDRDYTNDDVNNFVIRSRAEHASLDALRVEIHPVKCPQCGDAFTPTHSQASNAKRGHAGPFCSRSCAGRYGTRVQNGDDKIDPTEINRTHYRINKE